MARGVVGHGPANIMKHLAGIDFPADKEKIIEQAKHGEGPDTPDVIYILEKIDDKEYGGPQEIMKQIGEVEGNEKDES